MLLVVLVVALMLWAGPEIYQRVTSIPLIDAIANFNARAQSSSVGKYEPPLTENEVIAAIQAQLPTLEASPRVKSIYQKIANTRRLPRGGTFNDIPAYQPRSGPQQIVWWINLEVMTGKNTGYGLRIRNTDDPVAAKNQIVGKSVMPPDKDQLGDDSDGQSKSN